MDNILNITQTKDSDLEFDVSVEGIKTDDMVVCLLIHAEKFCVSFKCESAEAGKWKVTIPPLPFLDKTLYQYSITVVADGYFFEPMKGQINLVGTPGLYVSVSGDSKKPVKSEEKKASKPEEKKEEKKSEEAPKISPDTKPGAGFTDMLKDILGNGKKKEIKESNLDPAPVEALNIEDQSVKDILANLKVKDKTKELKKRTKPSAVRVVPEVKKTPVKETQLVDLNELKRDDEKVKNILAGISQNKNNPDSTNRVKSGEIRFL